MLLEPASEAADGDWGIGDNVLTLTTRTHPTGHRGHCEPFGSYSTLGLDDPCSREYAPQTEHDHGALPGAGPVAGLGLIDQYFQVWSRR